MIARIAVLLLLTLSSCGTTYTIRSRPAGARVAAGGVELGVTPVTVSSATIKTDSANGKLISLRKDGFKELLVWLPDDGLEYDIQFNLSSLYRRAANDRMDVIDHRISRTDLYRLTDRLLRIQLSLLTMGEIDKENFGALLEANPSLGSIHFLEAIRLLREKDKNQALIRLNEAMRLAPNEHDFLSLRNEAVAGSESN